MAFVFVNLWATIGQGVLPYFILSGYMKPWEQVVDGHAGSQHTLPVMAAMAFMLSRQVSAIRTEYVETEWFGIEKEVRQGWITSPYLLPPSPKVGGGYVFTLVTCENKFSQVWYSSRLSVCLSANVFLVYTHSPSPSLPQMAALLIPHVKKLNA